MSRVAVSATKIFSVEEAESLFPCSAVNQFPIRMPCFFTTFARRMPAARSGLRSPQCGFVVEPANRCKAR